MNFSSMNICISRTQYGMDLAQTADKGCWLAAFQVSSCSFCVTSMPASGVFFVVDLCLFC